MPLDDPNRQEYPESDNLYITDLPTGFDEASLKTILGAYGNIVNCKLLNAIPGKKGACLIRFSSVDEAVWIVKNLSGNIPQGLTDPIICKYAMPRDKGFPGKGENQGPYDQGGGTFKDGGGKGGGGGGNKGAPGSKGKCSIRTLVKGLNDAGALPGGHRAENDEHALFVAGLPYDTTDLDLYKMFGCFGPVKGVKAMMDMDSGMCKGTGFVNMMEPNGVQTAIQTLNGTMMPDGTWLTVAIKMSGMRGGGKGKDKDKDKDRGRDTRDRR